MGFISADRDQMSLFGYSRDMHYIYLSANLETDPAGRRLAYWYTENKRGRRIRHYRAGVCAGCGRSRHNFLPGWATA